MEIKTFTPIWLMISAIIGLVVLGGSSAILYRLTISQPSAIVHLTKEESSEKIKINKNKNNRVDTVFYTSDFAENLEASQKKESFIDLLPEVPNKGYLNLNPKVFRWIVFHSVALSLFLACVPFILFLAIPYFKNGEKYIGPWNIGVLTLSIIAVGLSLYYISKSQPSLINGVELMSYFNLNFSDPFTATNIIVIPIFAASLIPIVGIMLCNYRTYYVFENKEDKEATPPLDNAADKEGKEATPPLDKAAEYNEINAKINIFAFYLGLLVSCAVIGSGLQRDMIINQIDEQLYPKEILYAYGIAFSVILALFFIPSFVYLRFVGRDYQSKVNEKGGWWIIGQETIENLKLALSVSLPLISSIVQSFLSSN